MVMDGRPRRMCNAVGGGICGPGAATAVHSAKYAVWAATVLIDGIAVCEAVSAAATSVARATAGALVGSAASAAAHNGALAAVVVARLACAASRASAGSSRGQRRWICLLLANFWL